MKHQSRNEFRFWKAGRYLVQVTLNEKPVSGILLMVLLVTKARSYVGKLGFQFHLICKSNGIIAIFN